MRNTIYEFNCFFTRLWVLYYQRQYTPERKTSSNRPAVIPAEAGIQIRYVRYEFMRAIFKLIISSKEGFRE